MTDIPVPLNRPAGPSRFYDVATGDELRLVLQPVGSEFRILRQFGYRDPRYREPFVIPRDVAGFRTDLASIPWFFAWLIPGLGTHLPAILVHDGLVPEAGGAPEYDGPPVDREEADRILRDALGALGTPMIRRWLIWTGASIATAVGTLRPRWYWPAVVIGTLVVIGVLGVLATLDLFDIWNVLPWMGDRPFLNELGLGAMFAVLIPLALSVCWLRLWRAGAIAGVALAFLLHVTAAVMIVYGVYWVAERLVSGPEGTTPDISRSLNRVSGITDRR